jgi:hypothetical protein
MEFTNKTKLWEKDIVVFKLVSVSVTAQLSTTLFDVWSAKFRANKNFS